MSAQEQVVLTVSVNGYGKRTSSYEYRTTGRGGKGIVAMSVNNRNGKLVASFPVEESDQIMLVTDKGQLIRCPVEGIRIAGRSTQGVIVFDTAEDEHVVSVEHIGDEGRTARTATATDVIPGWSEGPDPVRNCSTDSGFDALRRPGMTARAWFKSRSRSRTRPPAWSARRRTPRSARRCAAGTRTPIPATPTCPERPRAE